MFDIAMAAFSKDFPADWELVIDENFESYQVGNFSNGYTAFEEFYYPRTRIDQGPWRKFPIITFGAKATTQIPRTGR